MPPAGSVTKAGATTIVLPRTTVTVAVAVFEVSDCEIAVMVTAAVVGLDDVGV